MSGDWQARYEEEYRIVDRCWKALGISRYEEAGGKSIDQLIRKQKATITALSEALSRWDDMITNSADVPQNPDSLPMMLRHEIRQQLSALQAAAR